MWVKVDAGDAQRSQWAKKRPPRLPYERDDVCVRATQPGGGITTATVYSHDLSAGGLSFLHPAYLHVGTALSVTLPRRLAGEDSATGRVAWCRHVSGTWHAVGVKFNEPISPKLFVNPTDWDRLPTNNSVRPAMLAGQVLMVDDQEIDRMLFAHVLRETKLTITAVTDIEQASQAIGRLVFDVVCLDLNLGVGRPGGAAGIPRLRASGCKAPFVVISGDAAARQSIANHPDVAVSLAKPYDADQLIAALAGALDVGGAELDDPLYSELSQQDGASDLLKSFCDKVQQSMRQFKRDVAQGRLAEVRLTCQMLRGSAGGFGYPMVAAAASDAVKAIDGSGDVGEADADIRRLIAMCKRLTPVRRPREAA